MTSTAAPARRARGYGGSICRRSSALIGAAIVSAALIAGCGGPGKTLGSITLYCGQHEQTTQSLITAFEKSTGINVKVRYDDEDTFTDEIVMEASHPIADVFYTENSPPLEYLQEKGLLAAVDASTLSKTPAKYNSPQGDWVGISARVSVLIYNPSLINKSQLPATVLQLADPKYKGKIAFASGETDFQPIVTSVDKTYGQAKTLAWLRGIGANADSHVYPDSETIANEVNRGAVAFGVVNQYYWYRMGAVLGKAAIHSKITYFVPHDPGYVLDVSGAAVLKSAKDQAGAQKFLAFLVSKQGQEIIAHSTSFEYPLDDGVKTVAPETPFSQLEPNSITIPELGDGSVAISLMQRTGLL
ncbi:MAG TPA: extracellular solute-binding protein [Acidimicrobiales bacterium]|nr:extracellular solute-binding protein [Acidimicrobiales bacterium]